MSKCSPFFRFEHPVRARWSESWREATKYGKGHPITMALASRMTMRMPPLHVANQPAICRLFWSPHNSTKKAISTENVNNWFLPPLMTPESLVYIPSFRLIWVKLFIDFELATSNIVRFRSTACNHGPVLRGCMIIQSMTCPSVFEVNRRHQSTA